MKKALPILILFLSCRSVHSLESSEKETDDSTAKTVHDSTWNKSRATLDDLFSAGNVSIHIGFASNQKNPSLTPVIPGKDPLSQLIESAIRTANQQVNSIDLNIGNISDHKSEETLIDTGHVKQAKDISVNKSTYKESKEKDVKSGVGAAIAAGVMLILALAMYFVNQYFSTVRKTINAGVDVVEKIVK